MEAVGISPHALGRDLESGVVDGTGQRATGQRREREVRSSETEAEHSARGAGRTP